MTEKERPDLPHEEATPCRMRASVLRIIAILLGSVKRRPSPWLWLLVEWLGAALLRIIGILGIMADLLPPSQPCAWRVRRMLTAPPQRWAAP